MSMSLDAFFTKNASKFREVVPRKPRAKKRGGATAARENFCADFETTTDANDCRVWAWGFVNVNTPEYENVEHGTEIATFFERIQKQNSTIYFHNLRFDGAFIIDWLLKNGFEHVTEKNLSEDNQFKSLISDMGKFYSITVRFAGGFSCEFRDSLKKLPMGVKRIAKSFDLPMTKGELDYLTYREPGHILTPEEEDYLKRDVSIIAQAMKTVIDNGMTKLTVASDALNEYKKLNGSKYFEQIFPVLHDDIDTDIRRAYRGGFTYADPRYSGRVVRSGLVLDVNSLYPSVMKFKPIPYDMPRPFKGRPILTEQYPLAIFSVTFTAKLKKDHIPCIQIKGTNLFLGTEYLREITEPTTLMVTNVDWDLYCDFYDINVLAYEGGWMFKSATGLFDSYIDKWSEIKAKETGGKREIAKLHLNSLYGKFASNPNVTSKIPILEDGKVRLVRGEAETRPPVYTAAGVFITAYARDITIRAAQENYECFAYADTDSLHLLTDVVPETIEVHPTKLGAWKLEYHFINAFYIRPKAYLEKKSAVNEHKDECPHDDNGNLDCPLQHNYENRIAGLPIESSGAMTFDDLVEGKLIHGKLTPKTVPGGIVLRDVPFKLQLH
jgi:hypothetical protein